jgi:hypothetical protein
MNIKKIFLAGLPPARRAVLRGRENGLRESGFARRALLQRGTIGYSKENWLSAVGRAARRACSGGGVV